MSTGVKSTHDKASSREATESELGVSGSNGDSNGTLLEQNKAMLSKNRKRKKRVRRQKQQSASKKLLVLDVDGLLVARYKKSDKGKPPPNVVEHGVVAKTHIYKRPFCDAFLQFCFENFHVGIWSSMVESNVHKVLDYIYRSSTRKHQLVFMKHQFAFVMHQRDCTNTGFSNPEKRQEPLFLKDLRNVWARFPSGEFNEKNTLLIDDTPYKALHNPPHTAIFPEAYIYDETDTFLMGPLREFLVRLIGAPDVQEFVRSHPIGVPAINPGSLHWELCRKIVNSSNIRVSSTHDKASGREATESELGVSGSNGDSNGTTLLEQNKAMLSRSWKLSMPVQQQSASKKLLVLDVNGLLVARYKKSDKGKPPPNVVEHGVVAKTNIYKRPFCDVFLQFCFENFHVGIWSSMVESNVHKVLDYIYRSSTRKHQFAFVMHQRDCTNTGFRNPEKRQQPLFLKDLRNVWARFPSGEFNEKNTLLIDDTPYKALHNPPHTAIFPEAYIYDETDTFLMGPLREFLVQLIGAPDVQEFVRSHPIGVPAINPGSLHWELYRKIVNSSNIKSRLRNSATKRKCN